MFKPRWKEIGPGTRDCTQAALTCTHARPICSKPCSLYSRRAHFDETCAHCAHDEPVVTQSVLIVAALKKSVLIVLTAGGFTEKRSRCTRSTRAIHVPARSRQKSTQGTHARSRKRSTQSTRGTQPCQVSIAARFDHGRLNRERRNLDQALRASPDRPVHRS
jgi:hypothetical protein